VYLQSIILGSLSPIVNTLKGQSDTTEYQTAVRADLLIDCIRHSTSPQVQNSALLLISNLASWVPDLILHNLMPIFTFIGSTLLRQQDDYSAQVVDKTISRVVPQLAASLRSKHKDFITGVSDLLLSFTAAFEHIPLHRRMKLFAELARTLGPADSLSAIVALLADKYHNKEQRRFCTDLLLHFDPIHTLNAMKGYLDLVVDAVGPSPKVAETLFGLKEKKIDSAVQVLLSCLADLALDEKVRQHVTRAFRRKEEADKPRKVFANIVETTIQLSKKVVSTPKLYDACSRVLASCLDLLPTTDLIKSAELLLSSADSQVQVAAIKAVELRAGTAKQNDRKSVDALVSFLPNVESLLQQSAQMDAKMISISCIDRIVERFGKKDVSAVASVAQTISGAQALSSSDDRVRVLSLICLTSVVDVLEDEAISLLPTVLPIAFEYLSNAIEEQKTGLHNAVYALLSNIVERLGYMFSREYLDTALRLSQRSAAADLEEACDDSRTSFYQSVSEHLSAHEVFAAIKSTWPHAASQGFDASLEHLELLRSTVNVQTKAKLVKASAGLFGLLLQIFTLRDTVDTEDIDADEMEQLEDTLIESVIAMVLKLSDATFRPFFVQLVDQEGPLPAKPSRTITFYKFLATFFEKFKVYIHLPPSSHTKTKLTNTPLVPRNKLLNLHNRPSLHPPHPPRKIRHGSPHTKRPPLCLAKILPTRPRRLLASPLTLRNHHAPPPRPPLPPLRIHIYTRKQHKRRHPHNHRSRSRFLFAGKSPRYERPAVPQYA
jgi:U3 small nucleolar RNA-associated protein 10